MARPVEDALDQGRRARQARNGKNAQGYVPLK